MKKNKLIAVILAVFTLIISFFNIINAVFFAVISIICYIFVNFENKKTATEKIVLIAIIASISSAGRILFSGIASVQPSSFIIMLTGIIFGPQMGFITGSVTALASNLVLGQGPWTIFQMFAWGLMGAMSGVLSKKLEKNIVFFSIYGFSWGFLFGWIMNAWVVISRSDSITSLQEILLINLASVPMDFAHGLCNVFFIVLLSKKFIKIFKRVAIKYFN